MANEPMSYPARPPDSPESAQSLVAFWIDAGPKLWFARDPAFDARFSERFALLHRAAASRQFDDWIGHRDGALALMLLLDQYPRNAFRGTAHMFATDSLARMYARSLVAARVDLQIELALRTFCYLPFMHSERRVDQQTALQLYARLPAGSDRWARHHHRIIERFGRFPHRNALLGRESTPAEQAFLDKAGFDG